MHLYDESICVAVYVYVYVCKTVHIYDDCAVCTCMCIGVLYVWQSYGVRIWMYG